MVWYKWIQPYVYELHQYNTFACTICAPGTVGCFSPLSNALLASGNPLINRLIIIYHMNMALWLVIIRNCTIFSYIFRHTDLWHDVWVSERQYFNQDWVRISNDSSHLFDGFWCNLARQVLHVHWHHQADEQSQTFRLESLRKLFIRLYQVSNNDRISSGNLMKSTFWFVTFWCN